MRERVLDAVHPMSLHPLFLHLSLRNWRWYLNDVRQALLSIVNILSFPFIETTVFSNKFVTRSNQAEKATHSSLKIGEIDYDANFADSQRLAKLCENLTIVQNILDSDEDVGRAIQIHCAELKRRRNATTTISSTGFPAQQQDDAELLTRVRLDLQRLQGFRRTAVALLKQGEGTSQLVKHLAS